MVAGGRYADVVSWAPPTGTEPVSPKDRPHLADEHDVGKLLNIPYIGVDNFDCGYQVATTAVAEWNSRRTESPEKIATVWDDRHRCSPSYDREAGVATAMAVLRLIPNLLPPFTGALGNTPGAERESIGRAVSAAGAAHPDILIWAHRTCCRC